MPSSDWAFASGGQDRSKSWRDWTSIDRDYCASPGCRWLRQAARRCCRNTGPLCIHRRQVSEIITSQVLQLLKRNLAIANRSRVSCAVTEIISKGHLRLSEMSRFDIVHTSSYYRFIVTIAHSCIVCHIKEPDMDSGWKSRKFYIPSVFFSEGWPCRNFAKMFETHKTRMIGLSCGEETITTC